MTDTLADVLRRALDGAGIDPGFVDQHARARTERAARVAEARRAHAARASADRPVVSLDAHVPEGGAARGAGYRPPKRRRRRGAGEHAYQAAERLRASMAAAGADDAAVRPITDAMWSAGSHAMRDPETALLSLPPMMAVAVMRAYTTPLRDVRAALDAMDHAALERLPVGDVSVELTEDELNRPAWDWRSPSDRKAFAALCVILAGAETTARPGWGLVTAGYSLGAIATVIPNPLPWRRNRRRSTEGRAPERYGYEAMRCQDFDARGLPRGAIPTLRLWTELFGLGLHAHQPDAGAGGLRAYERGTDGRWAFTQYWVRRGVSWGRWDAAAGRHVASPAVLSWLGREVRPRDVAAWDAFVTWAEETESRVRAPEAAEMAATLAEGYADAEIAAMDAHDRGDVRDAAAHASRAQAIRTVMRWLVPSHGSAARRAAVEQRGAAERAARYAAAMRAGRIPD